MTEPDGKKYIVASMPAILTGTAALIAALTTTYVSVRGNTSQGSAKPQIAAQESAAPVRASPAAAKPIAVSAERPMLLKVERIAVHSDGTVGTTDWRFAVEVDGEPRFAFEQDRLTDEGGLSIAIPKDAFTTLRLAAGTPAKIKVKGWRRSKFYAASPVPDAQGEGRLGADGKPEAIQVSASKPDLGAFTFYFSALPAEG